MRSVRVVLVCGIIAAGGCSTRAPLTEPHGGGKPPEQLKALPRGLSTNELRTSKAANQFTFTLFKRLNAAQPSSNVFVSPLSVSFSLGMTMNGANGTTLDDMRSTLGFGAAQLGEINDGYRRLMSLEAGLDPSTTFQIANSVWYRQGLTMLPTFVDTVKSVFAAEVRASPFDQSTITQVNDWVSAKTNGKIPTIVDDISGDAVMFLINAIYFKGSWRDQFNPGETRDDTFHALDGTTQTVKMMHRRSGLGTLSVGGTPTATVGELAYGNGAFVMTIVLPTRGDVNSLAATLDSVNWKSLTAGLRDDTYDVDLPRLQLAYERELKDDLMSLEMRVPFTASADFSRMSPSGLAIAFVKHKTLVDVNEEGTEAAAVTNTGMYTTSGGPPSFRVDRPFIFAIRERFSGTILFIGKIVRIP